MRIFLCAGEPSGDVHGGNLVRELQAIDPRVECVGYGGELMAQANRDSPDLVPFVDPSFIAELEKSGFIKKLYEPK